MTDLKRHNLLIVASFTLAISIPLWLVLSFAHKREKLIVSRIALPSVGLVYLAQNQGYFEEEGLDVEFISHPTGVQALTDIDSGRADLVTVYQTQVLQRAIEDRPIRILTTLHSSTRGTGVVARRDRGIRHPTDLVGRRVGLPFGNFGELFFRAFLKLEGIAYKKVQVVNAPITEGVNRFRDGDLDALVTWQPLLHEAQGSFPPEKISIFYSDVFVEMSLLAAKDETLKNKTAAIAKFIRALVRAERFHRDNPDESFELIISSDDFKGQDPEALRAAWNVYRLELKLDNLMLATMQKKLELRRSMENVADGMWDVAELIRPKLLEAASPEAVTVFLPQFHAERGAR